MRISKYSFGLEPSPALFSFGHCLISILPQAAELGQQSAHEVGQWAHRGSAEDMPLLVLLCPSTVVLKGREEHSFSFILPTPQEKQNCSGIFRCGVCGSKDIWAW